ncbi:type II secretion system GspH family protein [Candidatus Babeliales bacterium]|nr:type II secretion system GspH family protein [Candidatus Babeliales bacterium]MCF7899759.1 type II secretion system GspH family protein [Candidatus Babeliales bacterium]
MEKKLLMAFKLFVNKAFTFLEMMVVMVIIGSMITIIGYMLVVRKPEADLKTVLSEFNALASIARQEAIATQKVHRLYFQPNKNEPDFVAIQVEEKDPENPEKLIYKQIEPLYSKSKYDLPEDIKMDAFYIGKVEQFSENKNKAYCYIIPNGLVQDVKIYLIKKNEGREEKVTFKMEPFLGNFDMHEGFIKI